MSEVNEFGIELNQELTEEEALSAILQELNAVPVETAHAASQDQSTKVPLRDVLADLSEEEKPELLEENIKVPGENIELPEEQQDLIPITTMLDESLDEILTALDENIMEKREVAQIPSFPHPQELTDVFEEPEPMNSVDLFDNVDPNVIDPRLDNTSYQLYDTNTMAVEIERRAVELGFRTQQTVLKVPPTTQQEIDSKVSQSKFQTLIDTIAFYVTDYGATGDGSTDDRAAINTAHTAATANGGVLFFPGGNANSTYKVSSDLTFNQNVTVAFDPGAILSVDANVTVRIKGDVHAGLYQIFSGSGRTTAGLTGSDNSSSNNKGTSMVDTTVNFVTENVRVGDSLINLTDFCRGIVTSITTTTQTNDTLNCSAGFEGGTDDDFDDADEYLVVTREDCNIGTAYPQWFGAVGDGDLAGSGTDNDTALTAFFEFGAKNIVFPTGIYFVDTPVRATIDDTTITGNGAVIDCQGTQGIAGLNGTGGGLVLRGDNNIIGGMKLLGFTHAEHVASNTFGVLLIIYGNYNKISENVFEAGNACGIVLESGDGTIISDNFFDHCQGYAGSADYGSIHLKSGIGTTITNNHIVDFFYAGISGRTPSVEDLTIEKNYIKGANSTSSMGVYLLAGCNRNIRIANNRIDTIAAEGILISGTIQNAIGITITGNEIFNTLYIGIALNSPSPYTYSFLNCTIADNVIGAPTIDHDHGIWGTNLSFSTISGNTFDGNGGSTNGIALGSNTAGGTKNNTIVGNTISNYTNFGIYDYGREEAISANVIDTVLTGISVPYNQRSLITNNVISNASTDGITDGTTSEHLLISGNLIENAGVNGIECKGLHGQINGNTIKNAGAYGIRLGGKNQSVVGNKLYESHIYANGTTKLFMDSNYVYRGQIYINQNREYIVTNNIVLEYVDATYGGIRLLSTDTWSVGIVKDNISISGKQKYGLYNRGPSTAGKEIIITGNKLSGFTAGYLQGGVAHTDTYVESKRVTDLAAAPTVGTYEVGDIIRHSDATVAETSGWYCLTVGTLGVLNGAATTGDTINATQVLIPSSIVGIRSGVYISIVGVTGTKKIVDAPQRVTSTTVDVESATGQKVLKVTATTNFNLNDRIILDRGGGNQEIAIIDYITAGDSLTLLENLTNTQVATATVENYCMIDSVADATVDDAAVAYVAATFGQLANLVPVTTTGSAGYYPRRISQANIPTAGTGATQIDTSEMLIWRDSDDGKIYFVYNDTDSGIKSVEMT